MLTDAEIENGKARAPTSPQKFHQHNDCIRIAYEWLDAQVRIKRVSKKSRSVKHIIEAWSGRYVSTDDVHVAAWLHPNIRGTYPHYNISARLTRPSERRLKGLSEAGKHPQYKRNFHDVYEIDEV